MVLRRADLSLCNRVLIPFNFPQDVLSIHESQITQSQHIVADATSSEAIIGVEPTFMGEFMLIKSSGIDFYVVRISYIVASFN